MTGRASPALFAGVHTLRYRQSSLISGGAPNSLANIGSCMQLAPKVDACFTPVHGGSGCGAFQRSGPTGGAANGIPLNKTMPFATAPATRPPVTSASRTSARAPAATRSAAAHPITIDIFFIQSPFSFRRIHGARTSTSRRSVCRPAVRARLLFQEIDVGAGDESTLGYLQRSEQFTRFLAAGVRRFFRGQHDFELDERSEVVDAIEVDSRSSHEEHLAAFDDDSATRQHTPDRVGHGSRILARDACVHGRF